MIYFLMMVKQLHLKKILQSIFIIIGFVIALYGKIVLHHFIDFSITSAYLRLLYHYLWWILPVALVIGTLFGFKNVIHEIGLRHNLGKAFVLALIATSPMWLSSAIVGEINPNIDALTLLKKTLMAGFMEEWLFRGFLFGILFRKLGWGFIPAAMLGALIFASFHLYQGSNLWEWVGIFMVTFMGSAWFAWLYIEWEENLWIPIFLHAFMNLSWMLFDMSNTALGGVFPNIFRVITIAITVVATIWYAKQRNKFKVNKTNFWSNTVDL